MCKPTGGTITRISKERISRNMMLAGLLCNLEQVTQAVSKAKMEAMATQTSSPANNNEGPEGSCERGTRHPQHHSGHHHHPGGGDSSTEEEHSIGDSSGNGHLHSQNQSSIATRVRRKRHSRGPSKTEAASEHQSTVQHHYHDFASSQPVRTNADVSSQSKKSKGGIAFPFPSVLHAMLERADQEGFDDVVSWQPHGRAFTVHNPIRFVKDVMPLFFRQTRFASFQRQLSLYGFLRLTRKGPDHGAYYHELFVRGRSDLCQLMQRTRVKGSWVRQSSSPETEPDFTSMPIIPKTPEKAILKLPPLRNASSTSTNKNTSKVSAASASARTGFATPPTSYTSVPQLTSSYPTNTTGFGWTNSNLLSNMSSGITPYEQDSGYSNQPKVSAVSSHARGSSTHVARSYAGLWEATSAGPVPMQHQYFEPPPNEQVALAAFLCDVGLDSDEELRKELSQYDTEPLPWNSPSNQTEL